MKDTGIQVRLNGKRVESGIVVYQIQQTWGLLVFLVRKRGGQLPVVFQLERIANGFTEVIGGNNVVVAPSRPLFYFVKIFLFKVKVIGEDNHRLRPDAFLLNAIERFLRFGISGSITIPHERIEHKGAERLLIFGFQRQVPIGFLVV